jgi:hypothetical protein
LLILKFEFLFCKRMYSCIAHIIENFQSLSMWKCFFCEGRSVGSLVKLWWHKEIKMKDFRNRNTLIQRRYMLIVNDSFLVNHLKDSLDSLPISLHQLLLSLNANAFPWKGCLARVKATKLSFKIPLFRLLINSNWHSFSIGVNHQSSIVLKTLNSTTKSVGREGKTCSSQGQKKAGEGWSSGEGQQREARWCGPGRS